MISPSGVGGFPGSSVHLDCSVTGFPSPGISWLFNDSVFLPFGVNATGGRLTIIVDENTRGEYTCVATNEVGEGSDDATVSLLGESSVVVCRLLVGNVILFSVPPIPRVTVTPVSATIQTGQALLLRCEVESVTQASAFWTFMNARTTSLKGTTAPSLSSTVVLLFNITSALPSHSGLYVCSATNAGGTGTAQATVVVEPTPTTMPPSTAPPPTSTSMPTYSQLSFASCLIK